MDNVILLWDLTKQAPPNKLLGHKVTHQTLRTKYTTSSSVPTAPSSSQPPVTNPSNSGKWTSALRPRR
jgi:hypothetical protein